MRHHDLKAQPKLGMPCLGHRFETDQIVLDLNTADPFSVNFVDPGQVFSLQLGPRQYSIGIGSDRLQPRKLTAGAITFTPKGATTKVETGDVNSEFLAFSIGDAFFAEAMDSANCSETAVRPLYSFQHPDHADIGNLLCRFILQPAGRSQLYAETLCTLLLHNLMVGFQTAKDKVTSRLSQRTVQLVCEYVEENLAQNISLQELAGLAHMSKYHFARAFRSTVGRSPYAYVLERRVLFARQLIETSDLSLADISYSAGFGSQSHMSATFKKHFGVTPRNFR